MMASSFYCPAAPSSSAPAEPDDAESCCGGDNAMDWDALATTSDEEAASNTHQPAAGARTSCGCCPTTSSFASLCQVSPQQRVMLATAGGGGDDFEALECEMLLKDAVFIRPYPGGVDAALAEYQAAVSSQAATSTHEPDQCRSSCSCEHLGGPKLVQQHAAALTLPPVLQLPTSCPAAAAVAAARGCRGKWRAFEGDHVGAVLEGVARPTPSCDSCLVDIMLPPAFIRP